MLVRKDRRLGTMLTLLENHREVVVIVEAQPKPQLDRRIPYKIIWILSPLILQISHSLRVINMQRRHISRNICRMSEISSKLWMIRECGWEWKHQSEEVTTVVARINGMAMNLNVEVGPCTSNNLTVVTRRARTSMRRDGWTKPRLIGSTTSSRGRTHGLSRAMAMNRAVISSITMRTETSRRSFLGCM
jgi:hypothetical protein